MLFKRKSLFSTITLCPNLPPTFIPQLAFLKIIKKVLSYLQISVWEGRWVVIVMLKKQELFWNPVLLTTSSFWLSFSLTVILQFWFLMDLISGLDFYHSQQYFEIQLFLLWNSKAFTLLKLYVFLFLL